MSERIETGFDESFGGAIDPVEERITADAQSGKHQSDAGLEAPAIAAGSEPTQITIANGEVSIDATLLGELLSIAPAEVPALMRNQAITGVCERGIDADEGEFRLSFFHRNRRARLTVNADGRILHRSVVDFGEHPLPRALHRVGED